MAAAITLAACTASPSAGSDEYLIDNAAWLEGSDEHDPLREHRPDELSCPGAAWGLEDGALEVDTGRCNYLSLSQPSLVSVHRGDTISVVAWHGSLASETPSEAHIAVLFDGSIAWEQRRPIPAEPGVFDLQFDAPVGLPLGAPIQLHLHNHGSNTWNFLELKKIN